MYLAGSLAALAAVLVLFRCALYFAPLPVALAIGYIVLSNRSARGSLIIRCLTPTLPCTVPWQRPFSYSMRSGVLLNPTKSNLLWAGSWSAVALLTKLEFGLACFGLWAYCSSVLF